MSDLGERWGALGRAAEVIGVSRQWVTRLAATGQVGTQVTPLGRLYDLDDCRRVAAERSVAAIADETSPHPTPGS